MKSAPICLGHSRITTIRPLIVSWMYHRPWLCLRGGFARVHKMNRIKVELGRFRRPLPCLLAKCNAVNCGDSEIGGLSCFENIQPTGLSSKAQRSKVRKPET